MNTATDRPPTDAARPPLPGGGMALLAAFGVAYYALAVYAMALPFQARFPLLVWPADGLALGALLVAARSRWAAIAGIALVATFASGLQAGLSPATSAVTALVAAAEPLVAAAVVLRITGANVRIGTLPGLTAFLVNLVPIAALVSIGDAGINWWRLGTDFRSQWTVTFVSDFLNLVIVAPLLLAWSRGDWREAVAPFRGREPETIALFAGLVAATHFVFSASPGTLDYGAQLAYLCSPFLIWAALRFGLRAATLSIVVFALVCYWHTANGLGPFAARAASGWTSVLHLQGFVATTVVTTLFAATLLAEREAAAQTTEAWRRRYEAAIRASGNLLYELDPASGSILWDGDTRAVLGVPAEAIATTAQWSERIHPDDRARLHGTRARLLGGEISHIAIEYRVKRGADEWIMIGVNGYALEDPSRRASGRRRVIGFVKDITDRIRAEEERQALAAQLRQAEKMEAVGRLAGGIAHDFNNILGAILGYGELAQAKAEQDPQLRRYIDTIVNAGNRAKALVAQILAYSRAESGLKEPVILGQVATEVCELLRGSSAAHVDVRLSLPPEELVVSGDPTRLHQLIMNLASNAMQAMPEGGALEISLAPRALASPVRTRLSEVAPGEWAVLEVKDTGQGIPADVIDRIFEPFFTTKRAGRGTGLGLALVHSIVKEHGGAIDVASVVGSGTTFTVWLPRLAGAQATSASERPDYTGRGQTILAVDDEPEVLAALEEMLATLGYEPVGYNDSRAALEAFVAQPARFEAVISDEVMPGLTGTQLAVELRKAKPGLPMVIATGFGGAGFETRAHAAGVNRILRKPYRMQEIGEALRGFFGPA